MEKEASCPEMAASCPEMAATCLDGKVPFASAVVFGSFQNGTRTVNAGTFPVEAALGAGRAGGSKCRAIFIFGRVSPEASWRLYPHEHDEVRGGGEGFDASRAAPVPMKKETRRTT